MKRHDLDPFSLVSGALFALLGLLFLFGSVNVTDLHVRWVWPIPLIVLGALVIALAARRADDRRPSEPNAA